MESKDFSFLFVHDVGIPLSIKMQGMEGGVMMCRNALEGWRHVLATSTNATLTDDVQFYISCRLYSNDKPISLPMQTSFKGFKSRLQFATSISINRDRWNEWISFPVAYKDLPESACLYFSLYAVDAPEEPVAVTCLPLFKNHHTLRKGRQKLLLYQATTPSLSANGKQAKRDEMYRIEKLIKQHESGEIPRVDWLDAMVFRQLQKIHQSESEASTDAFLYIELQKFDFVVVHTERSFMDTKASAVDSTLVHDGDLDADNLIEIKHRRLVRSHRNGPHDKELKPNAAIRDEINMILHYPPLQELTSEEKNLLWKFRYYLTRYKKALTKFLKSVSWEDPTEVAQAVGLLHEWEQVDMDDALELLKSEFRDIHVREYAIKQLERANDSELLLYLLQLVQALRFEGIADETSKRKSMDASLIELDMTHGTLKSPRKPLSSSPLAEFLISRCIKNPILGNYFYWYVIVECADPDVGKMYGKVVYQYMKKIERHDAQRRTVYKRQAQLIEWLTRMAEELKASKEARPKKIELLQQRIVKDGLLDFDPLPLPLDPSVVVTGILPDKSTVFKSNMLPMLITFRCADNSEYKCIFKSGDDLRQDQLVVQLIQLMDMLLQRENLDLKLTPYKVLATGVDHGLVQFIPSSPLAQILTDHNYSILEFLSKNHPALNATFNVEPAVMETYVKSCAGYCVITYLLGVGDRHLDNLLLTEQGHLFHIDFGYILGRDPKPFPPPMKISKEMIDAMGGALSPHYKRFTSYCFLSFTILRKFSNLLLNLMSLMVDANIRDIAVEPDKAVSKVQEKFRLDLSEEESIKFFQGLINESVSALFPQVMETIHKWAQYWRK